MNFAEGAQTKNPRRDSFAVHQTRAELELMMISKTPYQRSTTLEYITNSVKQLSSIPVHVPAGDPTLTRDRIISRPMMVM